jgi:hypothetical protein
MQTPHDTKASQEDDSAEAWLQTAEQTTCDRNVESVISNGSGLANPEADFEENDENFIDLQLDADLQSVRYDVRTETESILRILDGIQLGDGTAVPPKVSSQLPEHGRTVASFFGDDIPFLKRKVKFQDGEVQKLIRKHADECTRINTATNEAIFKLQREKDAEIKEQGRRHRSQTERLLCDFEHSER